MKFWCRRTPISLFFSFYSASIWAIFTVSQAELIAVLNLLKVGGWVASQSLAFLLRCIASPHQVTSALTLNISWIFIINYKQCQPQKYLSLQNCPYSPIFSHLYMLEPWTSLCFIGDLCTTPRQKQYKIAKWSKKNDKIPFYKIKSENVVCTCMLCSLTYIYFRNAYQHHNRCKSFVVCLYQHIDREVL